MGPVIRTFFMQKHVFIDELADFPGLADFFLINRLFDSCPARGPRLADRMHKLVIRSHSGKCSRFRGREDRRGKLENEDNENKDHLGLLYFFVAVFFFDELAEVGAL